MGNLYRSKSDRIFSGVIGGIAEQTKIDSTLLRIVAVIFGLTFNIKFLILYLVCALIIPEQTYDNAGNPDVEVLDAQGNKVNQIVRQASGNTQLAIGIIIIIFGSLSLMKEFFWWMSRDLYWGLGIIALGIIVLVSGIQKNNRR